MNYYFFDCESTGIEKDDKYFEIARDRITCT